MHETHGVHAYNPRTGGGARGAGSRSSSATYGVQGQPGLNKTLSQHKEKKGGIENILCLCPVLCDSLHFSIKQGHVHRFTFPLLEVMNYVQTVSEVANRQMCFPQLLLY